MILKFKLKDLRRNAGMSQKKLLEILADLEKLGELTFTENGEIVEIDIDQAAEISFIFNDLKGED